MGIGAIPLIFGAAWGMPLSVTIFSVVGAVLGGRRRADFKYRNWWEKARPLLGGVGGILFGILGILLGLGIAKLKSIF